MSKRVRWTRDRAEFVIGWQTADPDKEYDVTDEVAAYLLTNPWFEDVTPAVSGEPAPAPEAVPEPATETPQPTPTEAPPTVAQQEA